NFSLLYRLSLDNYDQRNTRFINKGGPRQPDGELTTVNTTNFLTDQILNLVYNFRLSPDLTVDGILGVNLRAETQRVTVANSEQQFVYNLFNHQNFIQHNNFSFLTEERTNGVYLTGTFGYKDFLYLNLQGRNDWTSTLEQDNRSVFYPSASLSFVASDAIPSITNSNMVNLLKFRFGYGTSAGYPDPYRTRSVLGSETNSFVTANGVVLNTNTVDNFLGNPDLEHELIEEFEFGLEGRFFQGRFGVDLSLYNKQSTDLIVDLPLDPATGFLATAVNAADVVNRGIELALDLAVPIPGPVRWDARWNFTRNISEVNSILEGIERVQIDAAAFIEGAETQGTLGDVGAYAIPGEQYGVFFGEQLLKDDQGRFIVDQEGSYQIGSDFAVIGDPNPDYQMNLFNTFSWKGLSLGFQFQYVKGGDIYSSTAAALLARGNSTDSDIDRNLPRILPNAVKGDGTENDIQVYIGDEAFNSFFNGEGFVFDGTVLRLRQASLSYAMPQGILENTPFGAMNITLSGENLWFNAPNTPEGLNFDPEISSTGVGNSRGFDFRTAPTARRYGVVLSLTF
ncbi:MAG: SusC/RagA family TonB-linked outer membrane protein, partial [Bacteroidota bacterium]